MTIRTHGIDGIRLVPTYNELMGYNGTAPCLNDKENNRKFRLNAGQLARDYGTLATFLFVAANPELWVLAPLGAVAWKLATVKIVNIKAEDTTETF